MRLRKRLAAGERASAGGRRGVAVDKRRTAGLNARSLVAPFKGKL